MPLLRPLSIAALTSSLLAPSALFIRSSSSRNTPSSRVAYVNYQKILEEAPGRAAAESTYLQEMTAANAQLQQIDDSLKELTAAFTKSSRGLARGKVIGDREREYQQRAQDLKQKMQQRQADLSRPLVEQVSKVLDEVRAQGNYVMILDVSAPSRVVVSADSSLDITNQVVVRLKQLGPPAVHLSP